jgi:hypothetical protein
MTQMLRKTVEFLQKKKKIAKMRRIHSGMANCGWSETRQQHREHNTKQTMTQMLRKTVEFLQKKNCKNEENSQRNGETVAGVRLDNYTASSKQGERCYK